MKDTRARAPGQLTSIDHPSGNGQATLHAEVDLSVLLDGWLLVVAGQGDVTTLMHCADPALDVTYLKQRNLLRTAEQRDVIVVVPAEGPFRKRALKKRMQLEEVAAKVHIWEPALLGAEKTPDLKSYGEAYDVALVLRLDKPWEPRRRRPDVPEGPPRLLDTELGLAERLVEESRGEIRFCPSMGTWLIWNGQRWERDMHDAIIMTKAKTVVKSLFDLTEYDDRQERDRRYQFARRCETQRKLSAMIGLARTEQGVSIDANELDSEPFAINTPSGIVDLRTGVVSPHDKSRLMSKISGVPYGPGDKCPRWLEALDVIFGSDRSLISFVQRALGYSLTGATGEHCMFLCYGLGRNGKNFLLDTARGVAGQYATVTNPETVMRSKGREHPAAVADLLGSRLVMTSEVEHGEELAENLVKRITGDKVLKTRFMHENFFEMAITFKLWMLCNHQPEIAGQDEGIWSRIEVIPFDVTIPEGKRIPNLSDILIREEGPAILAWLVEGAMAWHEKAESSEGRSGLEPPERVRMAVARYRSDQDIVGDFLEHKCINKLDDEEVKDKYKAKAALLYSAFMDHCKENGSRSKLTARQFASDLTRRGFPYIPSNGTYYRIGLALKPEESTHNAEY